MKIILLVIFQGLFSVSFSQQIITEEIPTHYRRGIESPNGYQSYNQKYFGKNLDEEKRKHFPLSIFNSNTGVWTELNPKVPRVDYLGIGFVNKDTGWAVGDLGALIKTTDGGDNWTVSETNTITPLLKVRSYNGQTVIASGFDGLILRSTDGGETLEQITSGVTGDLWGLQMLNDTLGWACGNSNSLIKTTDGGQSWQLVTTPGYSSDYWWIDFLNENYGFIAANGKVLRTTDGGANWEIIQAGDNQPLFSIDVIDSLHIAAAGIGGTGYSGKNIYSSDGGYNWIIGGQLTFESVNCIQYVNPDTGYLVMTNVSARKTTNRGQSWMTLQGISDNYEIQLLNSLSERTGYSVGAGLQLNKAEDNLDVWNKLIMNGNFSDVFFVSEEKGFALGTVLYRTSDGGNNWESIGPGGSSVTFIDSLIGFIGNPGGIWKSTDAGDSWYITSGSNGASRIFFINETSGWAIRNNIIYKTMDSGENWFTQFTAPSSLTFFNIHFIDSLIGWTANLSLWPYKTTDGGNTWVQQTNLNIFSNRDILFIDSLIGFSVKSNELYKTTNSGNNWSLNPNVTGFSIAARLSHYAEVIFVTGYTTYRSTNAGEEWEEYTELNGIRINGLSMLGAGLGYAVGELGIILKYYDENVPVELISIEGKVENNTIVLNWQTASELNNRGFEIEKSINKENWFTKGFVEGNGTTIELSRYSFTDNEIPLTVQYYRLKQIDYDGTFAYSKIIEVDVELAPTEFVLHQNYPNPFNPTTKIKFTIPTVETHRDASLLTTLKVYDILGNEVATLVNETKPAGTYEVEFSALGIASGIYFYQLKAGEFTSTKKLLLLK